MNEENNEGVNWWSVLSTLAIVAMFAVLVFKVSALSDEWADSQVELNDYIVKSDAELIDNMKAYIDSKQVDCSTYIRERDGFMKRAVQSEYDLKYFKQCVIEDGSFCEVLKQAKIEYKNGELR